MKKQSFPATPAEVLSVYDAMFAASLEGCGYGLLEMLHDDFRCLMKECARSGQPEMANMCERRVAVILDEIRLRNEPGYVDKSCS